MAAQGVVAHFPLDAALVAPVGWRRPARRGSPPAPPYGSSPGPEGGIAPKAAILRRITRTAWRKDNRSGSSRFAARLRASIRGQRSAPSAGHIRRPLAEMGADLIRKRPNELLRPWSRLTVILCLWSSQFPHLRSEKAAVRQTQRTLAQTGQYRLCQCDLAGGVSPAVRRCPWSRPAPTVACKKEHSAALRKASAGRIVSQPHLRH